MAKFKCNHCGRILNRDLRLNITKFFMTKGGKYKSYCEKTNKDVFMIKIEHCDKENK